jgi:hypothetical protein
MITEKILNNLHKSKWRNYNKVMEMGMMTNARYWTKIGETLFTYFD